MHKFVVLFILLFTSQSFAQSIVAIDTTPRSVLQRENSCNIIFKKLSDYQCAGYLDRPTVYANPDDNQNMICLRLFEIYVINDCDSKARIMNPPKQEPESLIKSETAEKIIESPEKKPDGTVCGKENYRKYIGKTQDEIDMEELKEPYRIICFGCMATMDYSPTRVNFYLDKDGKVERINCG